MGSGPIAGKANVVRQITLYAPRYGSTVNKPLLFYAFIFCLRFFSKNYVSVFTLSFLVASFFSF